MTNEEKLNYIKQMHDFSMKYRIDDCPISLQNKLVEDFSMEFIEKILPLQPHKLYKYRTINERNLDALENEYGWFTIPKEFDDTIDTTLNIDLESEIDELMSNQGSKMYEINLEFAKYIFDLAGLDISDDMIRSGLDCYEDGRLNIDSVKSLMDSMYPNESEESKHEVIKKILEVNAKGMPKEITDATKGYLNNFMNFNTDIQNGILSYCLSEESDNDALWGTYADSSKGFCIEYTIPFFTDELSKNIRLNLYPIYYGTKSEIKFFDIFKKSVFNRNINNVNGITKEDYEKMFISLYTKSSSWAYQKEWRITFPLSVGNKQKMPFITAVILGERISEEDEFKIIDICKKNKIAVFKRFYNSAKSKIMIKKVLY